MEPKIIINGTPVTEAMAMTVRVAIEHFSMSLTESGPGDDIGELYKERIIELRSLMYKE